MTAKFHPLVADWFAERFGQPTAPQAEGWPAISSGQHTLIAAPTGSGKTLAAFLWSINRLVEAGLAGELADATRVLYVSPLKALGNDIERNLREPLKGVRDRAAAQGMALPEIRAAVRSGDTPQSDRSRMLRKPPHILITTPESLYILLTAEGSRQFLAGVETVIVDEIHAVAGDKRGAHLALSLERLDALVGRPAQRIGLSATQRPIEEIAWLLVGRQGRLSLNLPHEGRADNLTPSPSKGEGHNFTPSPLMGEGWGEGDRHRNAPQDESPDPRPPCVIVDVGHRRPMELAVHVPEQELGPIATHDLWAETYEQIVAQVEAHRATLVFVSTRRLVERVAHQLSERMGAHRVAAHHGSLSRETRLEAERKLKNGEVPVMVATASLELGIDVGHVDLVCHLGAPRSFATLLQRVGRSGHWLGAIPKGIFFPLTRDDLIQCAAAIRGVRLGELDCVRVVRKPLDILAQQIVAIAASGEVGEDALFDLVRRTHPYRDLSRDEFDEVVEMLSEGIATSRGRRSAHLHRDQVHGVLRARRGARLAAITSGGAIPDVADYDVVEDPSGTFVGRVHEDFAVESLAGDIFLLGNQSWRIRRVEASRVRVEDAHGAPPTIPFWLGEAPGRSWELSGSVSALREELARRIEEPAEAVEWLQLEAGLPVEGAEQVVAYFAETEKALGVVPSTRTVVAERFFDESGGTQLVLHAPFGSQVTRAWGLALRKRFCVTFDFELQAAATDDGIVISLGEQHSFPLDSVFGMVRPASLEADLTQAALQSPMFTNRWRWNASRALALLRHQGGRRVPMNIQRMRAEDLLAAVFPAQLACQDNHGGAPITPVDHPLVNETLDNCLHEAMDLDRLREILSAIERGEIQTVAVETSAPSPMSHEILNANPYAFLDDAPLEERRARAVSLRRVDWDLAGGIGALDAEAIDAVRTQAWPDLRDAEELHDLLLGVGVFPVAELGDWQPFADALIAGGRATVAAAEQAGAQPSSGPLLVAAERIALARAALGRVRLEPAIEQPAGVRAFEADAAAQLVVQGWLELLGPTTARRLAARTGLTPGAVESALAVLEGLGVAMRGRFTRESEPDEVEWCERRLLARIHRLTLGRLRQEIEPVSATDFLRFLLGWQHLAPGVQLHGRDGIAAVVGQLQGLELPAPAWESWVLPARVAAYDPSDLEQLCLAGVVAWGRLTDRQPAEEPEVLRHRRRAAPGRQAPLAFLLREDLPSFLGSAAELRDPQDGTQLPPPPLHGTQLPPPPLHGTQLPPPPRRGRVRVGVPAPPARRLSSEAETVAEYLRRRGASFIGDIVRGTRLLPAAVEDALWELVARGLVTGDGVAGLRVLLQPEAKRNPARPRLRSLPGGKAAPRMMPVGRWALWGCSDADLPTDEERIERFAHQLLRRYGVVFRELLAREGQAPPWRTLLRVYRRLEARGEIRGGRFVAGFVGEQFALPEAVEGLRGVRRAQRAGETIMVHSGDPLNLVGILTPGARVSPFSNQVIAYRDGDPVEVGPLGVVRSRLQFAQGQRIASP